MIGSKCLFISFIRRWLFPIRLRKVTLWMQLLDHHKIQIKMQKVRL